MLLSVSLHVCDRRHTYKMSIGQGKVSELARIEVGASKL